MTSPENDERRLPHRVGTIHARASNLSGGKKLLRNLNRIERRAFADLVTTHEESDAAMTRDAVVHADVADEHIIATRRMDGSVLDTAQCFRSSLVNVRDTIPLAKLNAPVMVSTESGEVQFVDGTTVFPKGGGTQERVVFPMLSEIRSIDRFRHRSHYRCPSHSRPRLQPRAHGWASYRSSRFRFRRGLVGVS